MVIFLTINASQMDAVMFKKYLQYVLLRNFKR